MKILLTGANGYIGKRLMPALLDQGHTIYACVRDKDTIHISEEQKENVKIIEVDFLNNQSVMLLPKDIDASYFLMHSLNSSGSNFSKKEETIARNYNHYIKETTARQTIYLGGISNDFNLSDHLQSRQKTEEILKKSDIPVTSLRAAIIIGSGGASFEIIRDLVEKLPVMIAPKWLNTKCQPIGVRNVIEYLTQSLNHKGTFNKTFDIGGLEVLTYKEMLLQFAEVRKMKRYIGTVPIMTPRLSSYWLYFVTSTSYKIAVNLVESMKNEVIVKIGNIKDIIPIQLLTYRENVALAFKRIEQNYVVSSWVDSELYLKGNRSLNHYITVPQNGTFTDCKKVLFSKREMDRIINNIWSIGGERGWYYGTWLWRIRGYVDKLFGGVGLRRGRRSPTKLFAGDSLDFWRVLLADRNKTRLLLFAEMKLPGEAWLEFKLEKRNIESYFLVQTATFRPKGVLGRMYWFTMLPFHAFIFKNMAKNICTYKVRE